MTDLHRAEIVVIGGGIQGTAAAWNLARRGKSVIVLEKGACGAGASGVNFGGVRQQGRLMWELPLSGRSRQIWDMLPEMIGTDGEFVRSGHTKLAYNEKEWGDLIEYARTAAEYGLDLELLDHRQAHSAYPYLTDEVYGLSLSRSCGHANPRIVAPAFANAARDLGATVMEFTRAITIATDGSEFRVDCDTGVQIRAKWLLNTAGVWGGRIAEQFGEPTPIEPIAPNAMVTEPLPPFMGPVVGVFGGGVALRQTAHGSVVIGGGESLVDMQSERARPLSGICGVTLEKAVRAIPRLRNVAILRSWAGVEGDMPDHAPNVGPSFTTPRLLHAFGFSQHGFQLGPAIGEALADLVTEGATRVSIDNLLISRWAKNKPDGGASTPRLEAHGVAS